MSERSTVPVRSVVSTLDSSAPLWQKKSDFRSASPRPGCKCDGEGPGGLAFGSQNVGPPPPSAQYGEALTWPPILASP